ncbi:prophage MuSo1, DNA transposition protein [Rhodovulum sp. P5]|uniref:AAA family ATPase n=1 Tax=Rhodovulum sp. P5 TaxID=1564506 RepID=UPI0009C2682B|nr:AAA family ATPase [Rhodovulum sp. P5]ARE40878.1 prophage MuSo1, DNA transposition protein [Rhodovulum sp. P5]
MKPTFVETSNVRRFMAALKTLDERGAVEACMVVVDGKPGLGKTTTLSRWVAQTGSVYLRAQKGWDYSWFIQDLLTELSVSYQQIRGKRERFARVLQELQIRAEQAALEEKVFGLVIDECDLVSNRGEIMEAIRGISDIQFMPTILVGMGRLRDNLRRFPQIESRAPNKVEFLPASIEDVTALVEGRCEVAVAPDLIAFVHRVSKGYTREILDAIAAIERFGRRFEPGPGGVTLADMAGQPVMNDRSTGKPIMVPGGAA